MENDGKGKGERGEERRSFVLLPRSSLWIPRKSGGVVVFDVNWKCLQELNVLVRPTQLIFVLSLEFCQNLVRPKARCSRKLSKKNQFRLKEKEEERERTSFEKGTGAG